MKLQTMQLTIPPGMIDLGVGQPSVSLLPLDIMKQAAEHRLNQTDPSLLAYGHEPGCSCFRTVLADFLTEGYHMPVSPEYLLITCGATHALDLICSFFARPGDVVFVEEPSYFLALRIFMERGLTPVCIPMDENGLSIDALEEKLKKHRPSFLYTIPTFHNPSGITLPESRRRKLVELSRKHDFFIVADEVYHLLSFGAWRPPPPMMHFDESSDRVLSVGSFTKILAPGLRLGWIQTSPALLDRFTRSGLMTSSGGFNPFTSALVRSVIELGLLRDHLDFLKQIYQQRSQILFNGLKTYLPDEMEFNKPEGGFFIWCRIPESSDAEILRTLALEHHVGFQPGHRFSAVGGLKNYLRLSFSYYDTNDLIEGIQRLATALKSPRCP